MCQAHLLLQLVLVALPGQLVLVLGPLGEGGGRVSSAARQKPVGGDTAAWPSTGLGAGVSDGPPAPPAELLRAHTRTRALPPRSALRGSVGLRRVRGHPWASRGREQTQTASRDHGAPPPRARVPAALTAWCCRVSSLRVFRRSSACTRICSLFSCSTAASYSCGSQLLRSRPARPPAQDIPERPALTLTLTVPSPPPGRGKSAEDALRPRASSQRRTHFELGLLLQLQRLLLHLRQAQRLLGVSCRGARALGHRAGPRSRARAQGLPRTTAPPTS